jgi:predicted GNAT family acetyltransferase
LRPAIIEDQEQVASINALMMFEENGVNPLERDLEGVLQRIRRRIEQRRVWVLVERGRIIFKAEVISETPGAAFIEGVYVHPEERGRGCGFRCLTELGRILLGRTSSLCLVVNEENKGAQALYIKAGYEPRSHYRTVYF